MKRILLLFILLFSLTIVNAETLWFRTTSFAYANVRNGSYYWSDWEKSNISISIDLSNDLITIYSQTRQVYWVTETGQSYTDNGGGRQIQFYVVDQDRDRGGVRLRIERNGNSQVYVDFNDVAWVYNVIRTN